MNSAGRPAVLHRDRHRPLARGSSLALGEETGQTEMVERPTRRGAQWKLPHGLETPWQRLYFRPDPHWQRSLRPVAPRTWAR